METVQTYKAKEVMNLLGITYSALRNRVNSGQIRSLVPPGSRQAVFLKEDVDKIHQMMNEVEDHYEAKEAMAILGMTYGALRNQVEAGHIHSFTLPGMRQAVYSKDDVDQLKQEMDAFFATRKAPSSIFSKATKEDMPDSVELSAAIFGGMNIIPLETRIAWLEKNPDIDYIVRQDGIIMAYASLVPLRVEVLDPLMRDEIFAKDLTPDQIERFTPGEPLQLYIMAMGVRPRLSKLEKRTYASRMIKGVRDVFIEMGKKGIVIDTIIARSETPDGINILRHMGFTEVPSKVPGTRNFIIDVEKSGIPTVMEYKAALREWQKITGADIAPVKARPEVAL